MAKENLEQPKKEAEKAVQKKKVSKKTGKVNFLKKGFGYFVESKEELKKVAWPTRKEAVSYAILVIIISAIAAVFLGLADYFLTKGLNELITK